MTTGKALNGKPYAGNPHVRFDEGEVASAATPRRGSLLYVIKFSLTKGITSIYNGTKRVIKAVPRKLGLTQDVFTASKGTVKGSTITANKSAPTIEKDVETVKKEVTKMSEDIGEKISNESEHIPNFVIGKEEASGLTARTIKFSPEDTQKLKKLEKISLDEYKKYRTYLIMTNKYSFE